MMIEVGFKSKFLPILEKLVMTDKPHELDVNRVSVTEVCQCLRKSFLMRKMEKPIINKHLFEGKAIHLYIEHLLKKYQGEIESEVEYEVDLGLLCKVIMKPDVVLNDRVVEIKTTDRYKISNPIPEHVIQANFYAFVLNKPFYEIIYIRSKGNPIAFVNKPDYKLFLHLIKRIENYHKHLLEDSLPEMETKYCDRCPFYYECFHQAKLL